MQQWQLYIAFLILGSIFGGKSHYKTRIISHRKLRDLNEEERSFYIWGLLSSLIGLVTLWFVSGWLLPIVNKIGGQ